MTSKRTQISRVDCTNLLEIDELTKTELTDNGMKMAVAASGAHFDNKVARDGSNSKDFSTGKMQN